MHWQEVFADAIIDRASAIIIAHNHPVGDLNPGKQDKEITTKIKEAGNLLGIRLLDHIIFNSKSYYSFVESDEL